jgi:hypothetical protein
MIKPTIGRIVWYHPSSGLSISPHAAIVTAVWSDTCINLAVFDPSGTPYSACSTYLVQDDAPKPVAGYAEWMPYQIGPAKKHAEPEPMLAEFVDVEPS